MAFFNGSRQGKMCFSDELIPAVNSENKKDEDERRNKSEKTFERKINITQTNRLLFYCLDTCINNS